MIESEDIGRATGKVREAAQKVEDKVRDTDEYRKLRALPQRQQKALAVFVGLVALALIGFFLIRAMNRNEVEE